MASIDVQAALTINPDVAVGALMMIRDLTQFKTVGALATEKMAKVFEIADRALGKAELKFGTADPAPLVDNLSLTQLREWRSYTLNSAGEPVPIATHTTELKAGATALENGLRAAAEKVEDFVRELKEARQSVDDLKATVLEKAEAINDVADDDGCGYVPPEVVDEMTRRMAESLDREICGDAIKPGDVVRHAQGGPEMMVYQLDETSAQCVWFADFNVPCRRKVGVVMLTKLDKALPYNENNFVPGQPLKDPRDYWREQDKELAAKRQATPAEPPAVPDPPKVKFREFI